MLWRNKFLTVEAKSLADMVANIRSATETLQEMLDAGVKLDPQGGVGDDYAMLVTSDPEIARRFGMEEESDYWGLDENLAAK